MLVHRTRPFLHLSALTVLALGLGACAESPAAPPATSAQFSAVSGPANVWSEALALTGGDQGYYNGTLGACSVSMQLTMSGQTGNVVHLQTTWTLARDGDVGTADLSGITNTRTGLTVLNGTFLPAVQLPAVQLPAVQMHVQGTMTSGGPDQLPTLEGWVSLNPQPEPPAPPFPPSPCRAPIDIGG